MSQIVHNRHCLHTVILLWSILQLHSKGSNIKFISHLLKLQTTLVYGLRSRGDSLTIRVVLPIKKKKKNATCFIGWVSGSDPLFHFLHFLKERYFLKTFSMYKHERVSSSLAIIFCQFTWLASLLLNLIILCL